MVTFTRLDVNEVIRGVEGMLRPLLGEDVNLVIDLDRDIASVRADRSQIEQIILNLAVNARDAMPKGGDLKVSTRSATLRADEVRSHIGMAAGNYVELSVEDTGCGIEPEVIGHIWEPFYSTKGDVGTGLGLSTIYGIVQQMGGSVSVDSEPARGSLFRVLLPSSDRAEATRDAVPDAPGVPCGSGTVLLVEDEEMVRRLVHEVLRLGGYRVLEAAHGEEALEIANRHGWDIDLLLTDVVMPGGMSGRAVAEAMLRERPQARVLYMSGYTDDEVVRHGVEQSGTAFIQKPFTPRALAEKVRQLLA